MTGSRRRAYLAGGGGATGDWYAEGAVIMGWTLSAVAPNRATLTRGDQKVDLYLYAEGHTR